MDALKQNEKFLNQIFQNALIPSILSMLGGNLTLIADGMIVGQKLGANGLSAINLCMPLYLIICIFGAWLVGGTAIPASKSLGSGNSETANRYCHQAQFLCLAASVFLTIVGFIFLRPTVRFLCPDETLRPVVQVYAWTVIASVTPKILIYIPFWYLRLDGKHRTITIMMLMMGISNILLDILFIYGLHWGIFGAGFASFLANLLSMLYGFWSLFHHKKNFTMGLCASFRAKEARTILVAGMPSAFNNLFQALRIMAINLLLMHTMGSGIIAVFSAVNGVASFTESVLFGVPQAASAMQGSFAGDRDYGSMKLLLRQQIKYGLSLCVLTGLVITIGAGGIGALYGLQTSLLLPLIFLSVSLLPAMISTILISYYNTIGMEWNATLLIVLRVFLMPVVLLGGILNTDWPVFCFLPLSEIAALGIWSIVTAVRSISDRTHTRFLRIPTEKDDRIMCGSVEGAGNQICSLSEGVLQFCTDHQMDARKAMKLSLAAEELLVLIAEQNGDNRIFCDLRLRLAENTATMTLRYSGIEFTPLDSSHQDENQYMGVHMLMQLLCAMEYKNISGMNVLRIQI